MAIKIKQLERLANIYTTNTYVYKDLSLDITRTKIESPGFKIPIPGSDIRADFDIGAIINSLTNLFNTMPGQRFLFPEYGLNLNQFLFEPATETNGQIIGERIFSAIETYEPRAVPKTVRVLVEPDNNQYTITLAISIPLLSLTTETNFLLDLKKQTFLFLPTARVK
jgi:phage baseplate assembly protein W